MGEDCRIAGVIAVTENRLKLYMNHPYPVLVRKLSEEDGGGWLAEIPGLLECSSDGETAVERP